MLTLGMLVLVLSPFGVATWLLSWWLLDGGGGRRPAAVPAPIRAQVRPGRSEER